MERCLECGCWVKSGSVCPGCGKFYISSGTVVKYAEDNLQVQCVQWFRMQHRGRLLFHIPNGRGRFNIRQAARLKRLGVLSGVPDLYIPEPVNGFHGLFVELKAGRNKPTEAQGAMIEALRGRGYAVEVCYALSEFVEAVNGYLKGVGGLK